MDLVHTVSSNMVSCTVWPLEYVLVEVHDQVDHAGDFHINVALAKHQQVAVVRHDIGISDSSSAVVSISSLVDVGPLHDWLHFRKCYSIVTELRKPLHTIGVH